MPVHDWSRVTAGTFHDFHLAWIAELRRALNGGLLPRGYYALAEQVAGDIIPDVLTLQHSQGDSPLDGFREESSGTEGAVLTVADSPPRVSVTATTHEAITLALRQRQVVIRHATGDRIVALIEIVSPGNKESQPMLRRSSRRPPPPCAQGIICWSLTCGHQETSILPASTARSGRWSAAPPTSRAPIGHSRWPRMRCARPALVTAYVEPLGVGAELPDMPLFLAPEHYVNVPLEETYHAAWQGVPERWRRVIESQD
jgi:hypothetical protein